MADTNNNQQIIDLRKVFTVLWNKRKVFYWVIPITFVLSSALILCVPRTYTSIVVLAPEANSETSLGAIGSLASSFGVNLGGLGSSDAIYPSIYPDLVNSPDFLISLFDMQVKSADGSISASYYDYLLKMQKHPFWWYIKTWIYSLFDRDGNGGNPAQVTASGNNNPQQPVVDRFWMTRQQLAVIYTMQKNIKCTTDKKNDMITITVRDQDKLIAASVADSVSTALQNFVTEYRTRKARTDAEYYQKMAEEASVAYQEAFQIYTSYADSHNNATQERYKAEAARLNNVMDQKLNIYNAFQQQYIAATAKLQESTPIYTTIQGASVPFKASSPKRVIFVLGMLVLAFIVTSFWLSRKEIFG